MIPVVLVYAGLIAAGLGVLSMIRPIRRLGISSRRRAAYVFAIGVLVAGAGGALPAHLVAAPARALVLDDFVPRYQFNEMHSIEIHAPPAAVYAAVKGVTAREVKLFRALTWIRSPHFRSSRESILAAPPDTPLLAVATRSGFLLLAEAPPRELVFGTIGFGPPLHVTQPTPRGFQDFNLPGYAKIAMNFAIAPRPGGWSTLSTETRIFATSDAARRRFGVYWRVIFPGSSLIRVMWLRAVKARAERLQSFSSILR